MLKHVPVICIAAHQIADLQMHTPMRNANTTFYTVFAGVT